MADDEEIKVRLTADLAQLQAGMEAGATSVAQSADAMKASISEAASSIAAAQADMASETAASWAALEANIGAAADAAKAEIEKMALAAKASTEGMEKAVATSSAAMSVASDSFVASAAKEKTALALLFDALSGNTKTVDELAQQQAALASIQEAGTQSSATLAYATTMLSRASERLGVAEAGVVESTVAATAATEANTAATAINGGVAREVGVLIGELARGNYRRLEGSTITLANRTGVLGRAFGFLLSPAGMVATALAAVAAEAVETHNDMQALSESLVITGGASGQTVAGLEDIRGELQSSGATARQAQQAIEAVSSSGVFLGGNFKSAASAIVDFAQATDTSIEKSTKVIEGLAENPTRVLGQLALRFHDITPAQVEMVKDLEDSGKKAEAAAKAVDIFSQAIAHAADNLRAIGGAQSGFLSGISSALSNVAHLGEVFQNASSAGGRLADAEKTLHNLNLEASGAIKKNADGTYSLANANLLTARSLQEVNRLLAQQAKALREVAAENGNVAAASAKQAADADKIHDLMGKGGKGGGGKHNDEADFQQAEYAAQQQGHELSLAEQRSWWQQRLAQDKQGGASEAQAAQAAMRHVVSLQKEMDRQSLEAAKISERSRAQAAKEASRQIVETFEMQRAQAAAASQQRIQIDAQMMDRVAGLYGQDSEQYRRALQERLSDTRAYVAAVEQAEKDREQEYRKVVQDGIQSTQAGFAHLLSINAQKVTLGQMTAEQQLAIERDYANQEYQIDKAILERWRQTFADRPNVVRQINGQIEALERKHQQQMDAIDTKAQQKRVQDAEKYLQPITRAFNQSIAGMIQGTQTFKQGWDRMLQSILLSFIQTELQTVEHHLAAQMAQTSATAAGTTARTTIQAAGAAESKTIDAATGKSQIGTAAATGAAKAYQAMVGIPYVGPIIAPIAAAVAFAGIEAFGGSISSAAGGWDRVPVDDAPALLHRNEMVLPANLAERVRGMTDQGGGGSGGDTHHHYHINAMDARSFRDWARRNPHEVAGAAQHARRKGY